MATILLAQEDPASLDNFCSLILDFFPSAKIHPIRSWGELEPALRDFPAASVFLTDVLWAEADRAAEIVLLSEKFAAVPFAIFGRYDLAGTLPAGFPIPLLAPDDGLPLRLAEIMENLSGRVLGAYEVSAPAGSHPLGRLYWAKHLQLQRSVQILVPPSGSPAFPRAIRALARVNHPAVYSLYESIPWENRILVAWEPVLQPSLLHLRFSGEKQALLPCARLATALGSVLAEMESSSVPARLLGEYDYTLSAKGTARLRNPAAYPGQPEASLHENARNLARFLEPLLERQSRAPELLRILGDPGPSGLDLLRQTREFEHRLAEVRAIHVRAEEKEAEKKTRQARVLRRWAIGVGTLLLAGFVTLYAQVLFDRFFRDVPSRLLEAELAVPAGKILWEGKAAEVGAFFLDRHEVTIGNYEKFLAAMRADPAWIRFVPAKNREEKKSPVDLEPRDWAEILRRARKGDRYQDQSINRDTPVFNVDFASAATYAAWKGRRLPTLEEWMRAASGDTPRRFPWGDSAQPVPANLGGTRDLVNRRDPGDSFFNAAPGESFPEDRGPFGHFDLGGNLSEWAIGPFHREVALGGNFTDPEPIPLERSRRQDANRNDPAPQTRIEVIGFRTAR